MTLPSHCPLCLGLNQHTHDCPERDDSQDSKRFLVDLPDPRDKDFGWLNVGNFPTKEEALKFIRDKLGGDEYGRVCLLTEVGP